MIYPPFTNIRKISANIAAKVAAKVYELGKFLSAFVTSSVLLLVTHLTKVRVFDLVSGLASNLPRPKDLVKYAESCMYSPRYRSYR